MDLVSFPAKEEFADQDRRKQEQAEISGDRVHPSAGLA